jgi:hypothetical protein
MQTIQRRFRVERSQIAFIKFIFEAYEGIACLSTIDRQAGLISLKIAPGCYKTACDLMDELKKTMLIEAFDGDL